MVVHHCACFESQRDELLRISRVFRNILLRHLAFIDISASRLIQAAFLLGALSSFTGHTGFAQQQIVSPQTLQNPATSSSQDKAKSTAIRLSGPPAFIRNEGQFDSRVRYQIRTQDQVLWVTDTGIIFDIHRPAPGTAESSTVQISLVKRQASPQQRLVFTEQFGGRGTGAIPEPLSPLQTHYSFFSGDRSTWRGSVEAFDGIIYRNLWQGIDFKLYSANGRDLEQDFIVHAGADPAEIRVNYKGIRKLKIDDDGSLRISTTFGVLRESPPQLMQRNSASASHGSFRLLSRTSYTFHTSSYDRSSDLTIDPTLLYSSYLGGTQGLAGNPATASANAIAVDGAGNAYVTGYTISSDFPTTNGVFTTPEGNGYATTAFVSKISAVGDTLLYSTVLGINSTGYGIAVDSSGSAYIVGINSEGSSFPTTSSGIDTGCTTNIAGGKPFFAKLAPQADSLSYSTCLGYWDIETSPKMGIALDSMGRAYVTGTTAGGLPTTATAFQTSNPAGGNSAFLSVIDPTRSGGDSLVYSTYVNAQSAGGGSRSSGIGVALDPYGKVYIAGYAGDGLTTTSGAFQTTSPTSSCPSAGIVPCLHGFITKFDITQSGSSGLIYSTYLAARG